MGRHYCIYPTCSDSAIFDRTLWSSSCLDRFEVRFAYSSKRQHCSDCLLLLCDLQSLVQPCLVARYELWLRPFGICQHEADSAHHSHSVAIAMANYWLSSCWCFYLVSFDSYAWCHGCVPLGYHEKGAAAS